MDHNGIFNNLLGKELVGVIGPNGGYYYDDDDAGGCNHRQRVYKDETIGTITVYMMTSSNPESGKFKFMVSCSDDKTKKKFTPILEKRFGGKHSDEVWILDIGLGNPDLQEIARDFVGNISDEIERYRNKAHYKQYYSYGVYAC